MSFVPGAASTAVRDLLAAPRDAPVRAVVRHVGADRVGLQAGSRLLVVDRTAGVTTLPCTVVAPLLQPTLLGAPGRVVQLDVDGVHGAEQQVRITRWWDPPRVRPRVHPRRRSAAPLVASLVGTAPPSGPGRLDDDVRAALADAADALLAGAAQHAAAALVAVLGRGAGSTPQADDAVAGLLLAARHDLPARERAVDRTGRLVAAAARTRTTALSAELLRLAAGGLAAAAVVDAITGPSSTTRAKLLGLGATSGAATAAGIDVLRARAGEGQRAA